MDFLGIGVGLPQLLLVLLVAMLVLGPERLPEVARQLARGIRTLRSYATEVQGQFEGELGDLRSEFLDIQRDLTSIHGDLRGGLVELDSSVRSVQTEMNSAFSTASTPLAAAGTPEIDEPAPPVSLDYVPAAPKRYSPTTAATNDTSAGVTEPAADGRLPDFRPRSR